MTAPDSLPLHALAEENLASASPDLLPAITAPHLVAHLRNGAPQRGPSPAASGRTIAACSC
ncbi:hypothetical protein ACWEQ2_45580 [Streptomyces sp. NPDC004096]